jgi:hypothetical protein
MTKPAAITGALVDMKNVATHKCLRLTIDVPAELAMDVIAAMGWPTAVDPVMVAVARLNVREGEAKPGRPADDPAPHQGHQEERRLPDAPPPAVPRRSWADLSYAQQAGIRCSEQQFQAFIRDKFAGRNETIEDSVRYYCNVTSRADLKPGTPSGDAWEMLERMYYTWLSEGKL